MAEKTLLAENARPTLDEYLPTIEAFLADAQSRQTWLTLPPVKCYLRKSLREIHLPGDQPLRARLLDLATMDIDPPEYRGQGWGSAFLRLLHNAGVPIYVENVLSEEMERLLSKHQFLRLETQQPDGPLSYVYLQGDERRIKSRMLDFLEGSAGSSR